MKRRAWLLAYQLLTGLSDAFTGLLLIFAPALTLHLMHVPAVTATLPYLSYIGVFVLSTGSACLYGGLLYRTTEIARLETVWLLTAISRGLVAVFVAVQVATGAFDSGWSTVAVTDGLFAILQIIGLSRRWLTDAPR